MSRPVFSSRFATFLTMVGVAVGLGNVWRFPYMMGQYGGSAFLLVYVLFMLAIAIPALNAEWALGRSMRSGPLDVFRTAFGNTFGTVVAVILIVGITIAVSYYTVVIANVVYATVFAAVRGFAPEQIELFQSGLANGWLQYAIALLVISAALWIVYRGVHKGIEATSRLFVPVFAVVVLWLVIYALTLDGAVEQLAAFLKPDFSQMGPNEYFAALGQACFSLGIGGTLMIAYGSYLNDDVAIPRMALSAGLGDMLAAVLASLFIVPTLLVFGIGLASGPALIFSALPKLFGVMPAGRLVGTAFLGVLTLMAVLSAVAALEVIVVTLSHRFSRHRAVFVVGVVLAVLMLPTALKPALIAVLDLIVGSGMQTLGAALAVLALTWGVARAEVVRQLAPMPEWFYTWLKYVVPAALLFVLIAWLRSATL